MRVNLSANDDPAIALAQLRRVEFLGLEDLVTTDFVPIITSFGGMTTSTFTYYCAKYLSVGQFLAVILHVSFTTGGGGYPLVRIVLPSNFTLPTFNQGGSVSVADGGANIGGFCLANSTGMFFGRYDGANWGIGAGREIRATLLLTTT